MITEKLKLHNPFISVPKRQLDDFPESVKIGILLDGKHLTGYYNHDEENWYFYSVNTNRPLITCITLIQGWYYL